MPGVIVLPRRTTTSGNKTCQQHSRARSTYPTLAPPRTINALESMGTLDGMSRAQLMRGNDGRFYVVKLANNPCGPRSLVNEYFASRLARTIGLSTPEFAIVHTSPAGCATGPHFGSYFAVRRCVRSSLPESAWEWVLNPTDIFGAYVFDLWTSNVDTRQFIFVRTPGVYPYRMMLIDHGHCFGGKTWRFHSFAVQCPAGLKFAYARVAAWSDFEPWLTRIEELEYGSILKAAEGLPQEWLDSTGLRAFEQLTQRLADRCSKVRSLMATLLNRGQHPFCSWRFHSSLFVAPASRTFRETA